MSKALSLEVLADVLAVARLEPLDPVPDWALRSSFFSISKTTDELSIVCRQSDVPNGIKSERNWRALKVKGPLDFGLTGVLASVAQPLATAGVSIFAISTFDTDYVLVKQENLDKAISVLGMAGHLVNSLISIQKPSVDLFQSFMKFSEDMRIHGETLWEGYYPSANETPENFVSRLHRRETLPEAPLVPETIYWGVTDGHVSGRISIRHRLEGNLHKIGGHIGYEVGPSFRKRGVAKEMLRQILLTPTARQIGRLLLTCSPDNPASNRTILANGGVLEKTMFVDLVGEDRNHYWITL